jgi:hypothetical protein
LPDFASSHDKAANTAESDHGSNDLQEPHLRHREPGNQHGEGAERRERDATPSPRPEHGLRFARDAREAFFVSVRRTVRLEFVFELSGSREHAPALRTRGDRGQAIRRFCVSVRRVGARRTYFPRTPPFMEAKSYSARSSSLSLAFFFTRPTLAPRGFSRADQPDPGVTFGYDTTRTRPRADCPMVRNRGSAGE